MARSSQITEERACRNAKHSGSFTLLNTCGGDIVAGLQLDVTGNIYVANACNGCNGGLNAVLVFSPTASGNIAPRQVISGSQTGIGSTSNDIAL